MIRLKEEYGATVMDYFCEILRACCDAEKDGFTKIVLKNDNKCKAKWKVLYDKTRQKEKVLHNIEIIMYKNFENREMVVPHSIISRILRSLQTIIKFLRKLVRDGTHISTDYSKFPKVLPEEFDPFKYHFSLGACPVRLKY